MKKVLSRKRDILFFVAPAMILYVVFCLYPLVNNIYLSFFKADLLQPSKYIGIKNYTKLLNDEVFHLSIRNVLLWTALCYLSQMVFGLLFAYLLFQKIRGSSFFQTVFFLPSVISGTAIALLWKFIYHPEFGILNGILKAIGLAHWQHNWLADETTAIYAIIVICMWQFIGYHMVIQLAGMKNIDPELFAAASIDGASKWQQFWRIMFPLLRNILRIDSILIATACLKAYDIVTVTTQGGPSHQTETLATHMYRQGFRILKFGYSSTIAVSLLVLCILFTIVINLVFKEAKADD